MLKIKKKLCDILRLGRSKLQQLTKSENLYQEETISTKGKSRLLEKPRPDLKIVQKRIEEILKRIQIPYYIQSPAKKRSYITNAQAHVSAKQVATLDIEDYFRSTSSKYVFLFFYKDMKCSKDVAAILTKLVTHKNYLPTGSPSSPIVSYFSHMNMWQEINNLAEQENCKLTVYIDDITISGKSVSKNLLWQIKKQLHNYDLKTKTKKEKFYDYKKSYEITGVIVTQQGKLKLPNRQHKKLYEYRQLLLSELSPCEKDKIHKSIQGLESQLKQIQGVNSYFNL